MPSKAASRVILALIFALFVWGLVHLFTLRFERGDIYPPYSTLRSDPLGCRALYDALTDLGLSVSRHRSSLPSLETGEPATLFFIGDRPQGSRALPQALYQPLADFLEAGGRLVICFFPQQSQSATDESSSDDPDQTGDEPSAEKTDHEAETPTEGPDKDPDPDPTEDPEDPPPAPRIRTVDLNAIWGFETHDHAKDQAPESALVQESFQARLGSKTLPWHSTRVFSDLAPDWQVVARLDDRPVIISRAMGRGQLIFCTDSYLLSNEGLKNDLSPGFLSWLIGDHPRIIFDESHLGIQMRPGIATLIRTYDLDGVVAAFFLMALLFVWKNASPLVPSKDRPAGAGAISDRDQASGLSSLFKRHIPPGDLLTVCVDAWARAFVTGHQSSKTRAEQLETITSAADAMATASGGKTDPVAAYREIHGLLSQGNKS